jgi:hypothetical protein
MTLTKQVITDNVQEDHENAARKPASISCPNVLLLQHGFNEEACSIQGIAYDCATC